MNNTLQGNELTVAQLAIEEPGALAVFTKYNIDYCCGGHRSLDEACHRVGLDPDKIRAEIYQASPADPTQALSPENWSSTFLVDFIVENHHSFVRSAIPELEALLEKDRSTRNKTRRGARTTFRLMGCASMSSINFTIKHLAGKSLFP